MSSELVTSNHNIRGGKSYYGFKNTWISKEYCPDWQLWHGLREILQNQYDGIIERLYIKSGKALSMKEIKANLYIEDDRNGTDFRFYSNENMEEIVGEIKYDEDKQVLTIWNYGKLERGNLLLGGFKDPNDPGVIGRFGEGMKLSALAICRKSLKVDQNGKEMSGSFYIYTNDECWEFKIFQDPEFRVNDKERSCLFWR